MSEAKFIHHDLQMVAPDYDSELVDLIIDLDYLRKRELGGTTHRQTFYQLKHIFQMLESLGSARIEGNQTTLAEMIEIALEKPTHPSHKIVEIQNIERVIEFVESTINHVKKFDRAFISEIHRRLMEGLPVNEEGDYSPGELRRKNVRISQSKHLPPDWLHVENYMEELFQFINQKEKPKFDLIKTAIAHHRFAWIHPFGNGNGRTVRMLTYTMLVRQGFNVHIGRILNPTAIFCINRKDYYHHLSLADTGTDKGIIDWITYVLKGLKNEIGKIDRLSDYNYLKNEILLPTIKESLTLKYINENEAKILSRAAEKQVIQASDIQEFFQDKTPSEISRQIGLLIKKNMLIPEEPGKRKYLLCFNNSLLLRVICKWLGKNGFVSVK